MPIQLYDTAYSTNYELVCHFSQLWVFGQFCTVFSALVIPKNLIFFLLDSPIKNESIIMGFFWFLAHLLTYKISIEVCWRGFVEHHVEVVAENCGRHISQKPHDDLFIWVFSLCWIFSRPVLPRKREKKVHCRTLLFYHSRSHNSRTRQPIKLKLYAWKLEAKINRCGKFQPDRAIGEENHFLSGSAPLNIPYR